MPIFCRILVSSRQASTWSLSTWKTCGSSDKPIVTNGISLFFSISAGLSSCSVRIRIRPSTLWFSITRASRERSFVSTSVIMTSYSSFAATSLIPFNAFGKNGRSEDSRSAWRTIPILYVRLLASPLAITLGL